MLQAPAIEILGFVTAVLVFTVVLLLGWAKVAPRQDWLEASFVALLGTVIFIGWLSTTLVAFGAFSLLDVAVGLFLAAGGLFLWQRPFPRPRFAPLPSCRNPGRAMYRWHAS